MSNYESYAPTLFLHVRLQNSCKKDNKCKKRKNARAFLFVLNLKIHAKKDKNEKKAKPKFQIRKVYKKICKKIKNLLYLLKYF